jgi:light-regulated signal transduction histidine kinase (bacteriophytochrome)
MENAYFDIILRSLSAGVVLLDKNAKILHANDFAAEVLGLTKDQFLGKTSYDPDWKCFKEDGSPFPIDELPSVMALRTGKVQKDIAMIVQKPDTTQAWICINAEPIFESGSTEADLVVVSYTDITNLKIKELELQRSNEELERFAYVASHDLQEPLRKINTFIGMFLAKNKDLINDKSRIYVDKINDSSHRMAALINDLLQFSRAGNIQGEKEEVDCNAKIDFVRDAYNLDPNAIEVIITNDDLPSIFGYKTQILALFQNLIGNGIKYNQNNPIKIHVGYKELPTHHLFAIKDNGIGIAKEDQDKVFLPFKRLHTRAEYAGSGIGLAICKKTVEKHKGKLWIESEVGEGSTFYFTIEK